MLAPRRLLAARIKASLAALLLCAPAAVPAQQSAAPASRGGYRVMGSVPALLRRDAPVPTSFAPDPSRVNRFNYVTSTGVNLNGVAVLFTPSEEDPNFGAFCTATRIGRRTLLTAAHCVTDDAGRLFSTTGSSFAAFLGPGSTDASRQFVFADNPANVRVRREWRGFGNSQLQYDVAVVNFEEELPDYLTRYDLFAGDPLGQLSTHAGFGTFGTGFGATGFDLSRRWGTNRVDATDLFGIPRYNNVLLTDFDGAGFDTFCLLDVLCDSGLGTEAGIAPGDSGGPLFINGRLAGVTSAGIAICGPLSDEDTCVPYVADPSRPYDSFGALNGFAPVASNLRFIQQSTIPEPSTVVLLGGGLAALLGGAWRRRRAR